MQIVRFREAAWDDSKTSKLKRIAGNAIMSLAPERMNMGMTFSVTDAAAEVRRVSRGGFGRRIFSTVKTATTTSVYVGGGN